MFVFFLLTGATGIRDQHSFQSIILQELVLLTQSRGIKIEYLA